MGRTCFSKGLLKSQLSSSHIRLKLCYWGDSFLETGGRNPVWALFLKEAFCKDLSVIEGTLELKPHTPHHSFPCPCHDSAWWPHLGQFALILFEELPLLL